MSKVDLSTQFKRRAPENQRSMSLPDRGHPHVPCPRHHRHHPVVLWINPGPGGDEVHKNRRDGDCERESNVRRWDELPNRRYREIHQKLQTKMVVELTCCFFQGCVLWSLSPIMETKSERNFKTLTMLLRSTCTFDTHHQTQTDRLRIYLHLPGLKLESASMLAGEARPYCW